ncbi:MAG TPA: 3-phosphoshikimate 1-carboxyvinyltransferase [Pirellulales bacterium]
MSEQNEKLTLLANAPLRGAVRPPGSKSITNRALICAALADGESVLRGALESEDTRVMIDSLRRLAISVDMQQEGYTGNLTLSIVGCAGRIPVSSADLFIANSGTSVRFLTALAALGHGHFRLDGSHRMRERPIQDLIDGLKQLGVDLQSESGNGCPPVIIRASGLPGGIAKVRGDVSSQFLSGLLMAAPYAQRRVELVVEDELVSKPYVEMTLAVMRAFGVNLSADKLNHFHIPQVAYRGTDYLIEPDASAASYFFAAAAITGGEVTVEGLRRNSLQGDVGFSNCLSKMGCTVRYESNSITVVGPRAGQKLRGIDVDMNAISDTVQTLAGVALFADGPTIIRGVGHIRHKETDRIGNLAIELRKLGAGIDELPDGLKITSLSPDRLHGARIETYNDHRMAMSLALVGLRVPGVVILNPQCTEKTYPNFFRDLEKLIGDSK